jgi:hypothetical protein
MKGKFFLQTSQKIRVFFKNVWFMSLSPNQEFTCPRRFCTFSQPQKMCIIIFFSASKKFFFCRNDVQAIDFLRKGSYAPVRLTSELLEPKTGKMRINSTLTVLQHDRNFYPEIV